MGETAREFGGRCVLVRSRWLDLKARVPADHGPGGEVETALRLPPGARVYDAWFTPGVREDCVISVLVGHPSLNLTAPGRPWPVMTLAEWDSWAAGVKKAAEPPTHLHDPAAVGERWYKVLVPLTQARVQEFMDALSEEFEEADLRSYPAGAGGFFATLEWPGWALVGPEGMVPVLTLAQWLTFAAAQRETVAATPALVGLRKFPCFRAPPADEPPAKEETWRDRPPLL